MTDKKRNKESQLLLRELYPHLSEEELKQVGETLWEYVSQTVQQYERIYNDPAAYAEFKQLTSKGKHARMKGERST